MKTVKKFFDATSANITKGMLQSCGIHAAILHEDSAYGGIFNKTGYMQIELVVNDDDYDRAMEILQSVEEGGGIEPSDEKINEAASETDE